MTDDLLTDILQHRRIPHSYSKRRRGGGGSGDHSHGFDPRRACAIYEVRCKALDQALSTARAEIASATSSVDGSTAEHAPDGGAVEADRSAIKAAKKADKRGKKSVKKGELKQQPSMLLEVHALNEHGDALVCSFSAGGLLVGMGFLAGSRGTMDKVLRRMNGTDDDNHGDHSDGSKHSESCVPSADDDCALEGDGVSSESQDEGERDNRQDDVDEAGRNDNEMDEEDRDSETLDEDTSTSKETFVKNSFRSPKFWFRWRARSATDGSSFNKHTARTEVLQGSAYIVFSGNDCSKFSGTITCSSLDLEDDSMKGKRASGRPRAECPMSWKDFNLL